ncbi:hypothetical protein [Nostoc sp. CHAB 5715]|uniref:hypothetical protein n=1 Tax=Nostoc sp. CHAB 5715 TaxID=2780400 RepID=UPI001E558447|nr:hypothetical protein [Nostoc sp. CHAB 5715]MCC5621251.1 hypothetical protein [Nostoc sp. CHAB 5715]
MTFAISKELQFLAGHGFYVKLTPMSNALYPYRVVYLPENSCNEKIIVIANASASRREEERRTQVRVADCLDAALENSILYLFTG